MNNLPAYIYLLFIATVIATLFFLYMGTNRSKWVLVFCCAWLLLQGAMAMKGFYIGHQPPHFLLLVLPPVLTVIVLSFTPIARKLREICKPEWLTLLHSIRLGVESVLFLLFVHKQVPQLLTFEGGNFDIFSGLTAPLIAYFGYHKKMLHTRILLTWNIICLVLLFNAMIRAILSAPFPFQQFGFDQPNMAIFYFPFNWLPGFVVPVVLFCHLISIRKLLRARVLGA